MKPTTYNFLVIEDNLGDFILVSEFLRMGKLLVDKIIHSSTMSAVDEKLNGTIPDIILLDLSLPDSFGEESVISIIHKFPKIPVIVFSGLDDIEVSLKAITLGAQDYLIKGEFDENSLAKSVQYSMERKRVLEILRENDERFKILIDKATNDIVWDWDIHANKIIRGKNIKNLVEGEDGMDENDIDWLYGKIVPEDADRVKQSIQHCIANKIERWQEEYRIFSKQGGVRDILDRGFLMFDPTGQPVRMIGSMTDLTTIKQLEKEIAEQQLAKQRLITQIAIEAQEKEKTQLGKELHDNISQILATVKMYLGMIKPEEDPENYYNFLAQTKEYVVLAISEIRKLSHSLVAPSLGDVRLEDAISKVTDNFNALGLMEVQFISNHPNFRIPDPDQELTVYRIVQEQMNNIHKYAKCKHVKISLSYDDHNVQLSIHDDGIGFDPQQKAEGIGLKNIRNRVDFYSGQVTIVSAPGEGCKLDILMPVSHDHV